ncbi:hypothetical protein U1Q18_027801 [Sarracenia purpurea var. burkii]
MKRQYQKLDSVSNREMKSPRASSHRQSKTPPPRPVNNLLGRVQDAYVDMMLCLAGNMAQLNVGDCKGSDGPNLNQVSMGFERARNPHGKKY